MKRCVIFSYGPVPSPEQDKVEGGGLRCWGLAQGLQERYGKMLDITVAYHESYKKENSPKKYQGVSLATWNNDSLKSMLNEYETIIVSYCMGDLSVIVAENIRADQQLVLDCYVPAYIEISARQSEDINGEYAAFANEIGRWSQVLRRGDLFLCANANQKRFYQGVLSALGRINPATYSDNMILTVPYGVYKEKPRPSSRPIDALLHKKDTKAASSKKLLWFGGIYPWFDIKALLKAVDKANESLPIELIIVGAKNPFNAHPDFVKSYDDMIDYLNHHEQTRLHVILQGWVEFEDRVNWYLDSDLVILINKIGEENELAWRTRLVDYIWADLPILTNGGDPLGEELLSAGAALKLSDLSVDGMASSIVESLKSDSKLREVRTNVKVVREKYFWDNVVMPLGEGIISGTRPSDVSKFGLLDVIGRNASSSPSRVKRALRKARKLPRYYKKYGMRNTYFNIRGMIVRRSERFFPKHDSRVVFVAHQLDTTGAPHVFLDLVSTFKKEYPAIPIDFHTYNPADSENIKRLNRIGIKPKIYVAHDIEINYNSGDVVVLNSVAYQENVRHSLYSGLEAGVIKKMIWYIHEDEPSYIFNPDELNRIRKLLESDRIEIFVLAKQTRKNYVQALDSKKNIELEGYGLDFPEGWYEAREPSDFDDLRFILTGMMGDSRKGQLPLAYAFMEFKKRYYQKNKDLYRQFTLTYVGVGQDFPSRQLMRHVGKGLGASFRAFPPQSHAKCLEMIKAANVTLCYSIRESLPLYVYEGMAAGHPILRNDASGMDEQLEDGINGYYLDSMDFEQVVSTIEKLCNKQKTTNEQLALMSQRSVAISKSVAADNHYSKITAHIKDSFSK